MSLIREIQKLTLDPSTLTHIKRSQPITNGTSIIQIRVDEQHGRVPFIGMA